ncbi:MAG: ATP-dependent helicase [Nanoarchaeota archaeon]|nr:ATP-dependent helicase [Nanoarchaeota archaeon]
MQNKFLLNKEQKEAINIKDGNLLILASAGTGKTTTIVERYINLVENNDINPNEVMITTFTNKAAKDMIKKIKKRTNKLPKYLGTMHSLFLNFLRKDYKKINLNPNFTLLTEDNDKKKIIKEILKEKEIKFKNGDLLYFIKRISMYKSRGINHEDLDEFPDLVEENKLIEEEVEAGDFISIKPEIRRLSNHVYKKYQEKLKKSNLLDFDDILLFTYLLLEKNKNLRKKYKKSLKVIMVDEAQDLNIVQRNILEFIQNNNLCLIGDDCQNIYSWRGTSNTFIFRFDKKHKKIILKDNYRSSKKIIDNINKIIDSVSFKIDKSLDCTREEGEEIKIKEFYDFEEEISFITDEIKEILIKEKAEDISVLFRTNNIGKKIERECRRKKIPCHLSRARSFFEREEIKDILSFLKLKINPSSVMEFERILSLLEGIGKVKIEKLKEISFKKNIPVLDSFNYLNELNMSLEVKNSLINLRNLLKSSEKNPISSFLGFFNYEYKLEKKYKSEQEKIDDKMENIKVLKELFKEFDNSKVKEFLDSLIEMEKKEKDDRKVILSTIHSAKGLEWKHVYLAGCNENILPFYRDELSKLKKDDELRLFYVAVSRAKDFLTITYSNNHQWRELEPSQFLDVIEGDREEW